MFRSKRRRIFGGARRSSIKRGGSRKRRGGGSNTRRRNSAARRIQRTERNRVAKKLRRQQKARAVQQRTIKERLNRLARGDVRPGSIDASRYMKPSVVRRGTRRVDQTSQAAWSKLDTAMSGLD